MQNGVILWISLFCEQSDFFRVPKKPNRILLDYECAGGCYLVEPRKNARHRSGFCPDRRWLRPCNGIGSPSLQERKLRGLRRHSRTGETWQKEMEASGRRCGRDLDGCASSRRGGSRWRQREEA